MAEEKKEERKEKREKKRHFGYWSGGDGVLGVDIELCVQSSCYSSEQWKNGQRRNCFSEISYCFRDENRDVDLLLSLEISFKWV